MTNKKSRRAKGMGSVSQRASDGRWIGYVTLPSDPRTGARRRKQVTGRTKQAVDRKVAALRKDLDKAGDLLTSSPTVTTWMARHDERHLSTLKPRAAEAARSAIRNYIVPSVGRIKLENLSAEHVYRLHDYVIKDLGLSTTTANQAHRVLRKALADAIREIGLARNVAEVVAPPAVAVSAPPSLTAAQAKTLLSYHRGDPLVAMRLAIALLAGMRQGEALGLRWQSIDFERKMIVVDWQLQSLSYVHGCDPKCGNPRPVSCPVRTFAYPAGEEIVQVRGALHLLRPKSRKGWREIPVPEPLLRLLEAYRDEHAVPHEHGLVFVRPDGHPVAPRQDARLWEDALMVAGLPKMRLHSARNTTATLLFELGVAEQTRMAILGHSSATVTQGYTNVADAEMATAMGRLGDLLAVEP